MYCNIMFPLALYVLRLCMRAAHQIVLFRSVQVVSLVHEASMRTCCFLFGNLVACMIGCLWLGLRFRFSARLVSCVLFGLVFALVLLRSLRYIKLKRLGRSDMLRERTPFRICFTPSSVQSLLTRNAWVVFQSAFEYRNAL